MKEVYGDIWDYKADYLLITTNGDINRYGFAVMGRGVAKQASEIDFHIKSILAEKLKLYGNHVCYLKIYSTEETYTTGKGCIAWVSFPVKHHWHEKADLDLIKRSAQELTIIIDSESLRDKIFVLPRPGCGNGSLKWEDVKPVIENILPDNVHVITYK